jgi:rhodanese-related sulfurtransferase
MKKLVIIALLLLVISVIASGCDYVTGAALAGTPSATPTVKNLTPEQTYTYYMVSSYRIQLIDVRTPQEYADGHLCEAINIDVNSPDFRSNIDQLLREAVYIVYCKSGGRSASACKIMIEYGFTRVNCVVGGGFNEIAAQGFPTE